MERRVRLPSGSEMLPRLRARNFPETTPLHAFFAWNEARLVRDRRFIIAGDIYRLFTRFGANDLARDVCLFHLAVRPVIRWRWRERMILIPIEKDTAAAMAEQLRDRPAAIAARQVLETVLASIGSADRAAHAAVFQAFEALEAIVDLDALAGLRPRWQASRPPVSPRRILVIKLSALGDFIQALGPAAALRRHHRNDRITLLTTGPYASFARQTGLFDDIIVDRRPKALDIKGWLDLRRVLRTGRFDRVYDLQTSDRSSFYAWLLRPGAMPQWSGIAWHGSHPHANINRHPQHTIDKQAEQLLMAGIYPVPLPACPATAHPLPAGLTGRSFVLLIPGSSPRHPDKRWPAGHYGALARRLHEAGYLPVIVGTASEKPLAQAIQALCPAAIDLVGQTDLAGLAGLAGKAAFTVGNDTGAMHMAAAGGQPIVVLFSQASEPSRCAPRGGLVRVLAQPDLADLPVEAVFNEAIRAARASAET